MNELIHLIGFVGGMVLVTSKFASGSLTRSWLIIALALNLILGLWPVVLQRYNRLRLYRAISAYSRLLHRSANKAPVPGNKSPSVAWVVSFIGEPPYPTSNTTPTLEKEKGTLRRSVRY